MNGTTSVNDIIISETMISKERQCIQATYDFQLFYARGKLEKLWVIFNRAKQKIITPPAPKEKTALNLWHLHGIDKNKYSEHRAIRLLNQWLDILYGAGTAKGLDIEERCNQKWHNNIKMNMPFYTEDNAPHFHFRHPFDCVLDQISEELPPYK